ncbi:MAG: hypothetical protein WBJ75_04965 [Pseudohongiellaceae bacterium]
MITCIAVEFREERPIDKKFSAGIAISTADGHIAAIASANGFAVATRDKTPFEAVDLNVIDSWS